MRDEDYLIGTYRTHGHAIARGTDPKRVMAELFGRVDGDSRRPRRLDAHVRPRAALHGRLRDRRRQPADRRRPRRSPPTTGRRRGHRLHVRRRRLQPGQLRRDDEPGGALEAAGRLPGREQPVRHGHGARAPLGQSPTSRRRRRASASPACASTAWTCSTVREVVAEAHPARARGAPARRWSRPSPTASAATRWPTPRSTATKEEVEEWREKDPIETFARPPASRRACSPSDEVEEMRDEAERARRRGGRVRRRLARAAARVALRPPLRARRPGAAAGTRSTSARPTSHRGEDERECEPSAARELAEARRGLRGQPTRPRPDEAEDGDAERGRARGAERGRAS